MNAILGFKKIDEEDTENLICRDDLREQLNFVHEKLMMQISLNALLENESEVKYQVCHLSIMELFNKILFCKLNRKKKRINLNNQVYSKNLAT